MYRDGQQIGQDVYTSKKRLVFEFHTTDLYKFVRLLVCSEHVSHSIETIGRHLFAFGQLLIDYLVTIIVVGALNGTVD
jgi:hypothetical protein